MIDPIIRQWCYFLLLSVLFFPKTCALFKFFSDRGYILGKIAAWVLTGYLLWVAASLHILPNTRAGMVLILLLVPLLPPYSLLSIASGVRLNKPLLKESLSCIRQKWFIFLGIEILFLLLVFAYSYVRAFRPDIYGAEKMMDFAFLHIIMKSKSIPPPDPWFAGGTINYYYFGYFLCAITAKVMGIVPGIAFNLSLSTIAALTLLGAYSLARFFIPRWIPALFSALCVSVLGNFDASIQLFEGVSAGSIDIWRSSRVIEKTINEFPSFSFLFADLHAHVMAIPLDLLTISLMVCFVHYISKEGKAMGFREHPMRTFFTASGAGTWGIAAALMLGVLMISNIWDFIIYWGLFFIALFWSFTFSCSNAKGEQSPSASFPIRSFVTLLAVMTFTALLVASPHLLHYSGSQQGIRLVKQRSDVFEFLTHYGLFFIPILFLGIQQLRSQIAAARQSGFVSGKLLTVLLLGMGLAFYLMLQSLVLLMLLFLTWMCIGRLLSHSEHSSSSEVASNVLMLSGIGLLLICELVYIKDFYGGQPRMNTVFKFGYQAWIMLALINGKVLHWLRVHRERERRGSYAVPVLAVALFLAAAAFPAFGYYSYSNHYARLQPLDGTAFLDRSYPSESRAIRWLKAKRKPLVILEAPGDSYQFHSIYATFAGHQDVVGWQQHESLWRDWSWKKIRARASQVDNFYHNPQNSGVIKEYGVKYIVFGTHEKKKYGNHSLSQLMAEYRIVFRNDKVIIFDTGLKSG